MSALATSTAGSPFGDSLDDPLFDVLDEGSESDSWLMSYLDLLMLLVTFFVLMLALYAGRPAVVEPSLFASGAPAMPPAVAMVTAPPAPPNVSNASNVSNDSAGPPPPTSNENAKPTPRPSAAMAFYRPPKHLAAAPVASDTGFYAVGERPARPSVVPPRLDMVYSVPLFDVAPPPASLPKIDGVEVTAIPRGYNLRIEDHLLFDSSAVDVSDGGQRLVERLLPLIEQFDGTLSVEGHTDSVPIATLRFPSNWELSAARASAVVRALRQAGIPAERLRATGYADVEPLADNATAEGRARNRRVEIVLQNPQPTSAP
ncbi:OmpA family protein [Salinicola halophilus]|uniref:OmpA family protein n=1 Tax=Salinicola halophilus TaxID=184065 RepID=UPI001EF7BB74|nr:OmpA family protein [Salinicola halophilus]